MKSVLYKVIVITTLMLNFTLAQAAFLSFTGTEDDSSIILELGETVSLSFGIFDLSESEDLGGYDIDLTILGSSVTLDSAVSVAPPSFDLSEITQTANTLNLFGLSFLFDLSGQADGFLLGELVLTAVSLGITTVTVTDAELSDAFGFSIDASNFSATFNVIQEDVPQVSAPPIVGLLMALLSAFFVRHSLFGK